MDECLHHTKREAQAWLHLGKVSYYLGQKTSLGEIRKTLGDLKTNEDTSEALDRVAAHLADSGVDLEKTPMKLGPKLAFDPKAEVFPQNDKACELLTREYRAPFIVPKAGEV